MTKDRRYRVSTIYGPASSGHTDNYFETAGPTRVLPFPDSLHLHLIMVSFGKFFYVPKEFSSFSYTELTRKHGMNCSDKGTTDRTNESNWGYIIFPQFWPSHRCIEFHQSN